MFYHFFICQWLFLSTFRVRTICTFEEERVKLVFQIPVQWCPRIALLAHRTCYNQVSLAVITDYLIARRISNLIVSAYLLPLLDALRAEYALALATLFCFNRYHHTDSAHKMLVKLVFVLFCSRPTILWRSILGLHATERCWVNLYGQVGGARFATCHNLFDLLVLQDEETVGVLIPMLMNW